MRKKYSTKALLLIMLITALNGCSTQQSNLITPNILMNKDSVYSNQSNKQNLSKDTKILVNNNLLDIRKVTINDTLIRTGPGHQYPIKDQILKLDTIVVGLSKYKEWIKIIDSKSNHFGWVHQQSLSDQRPIKGQSKLSIYHLPRLHAISPIKFIYSIRDIKPVEVKIYKGKHVFGLKFDSHRTLAWIPHSNTIAWLSNTQVQ